MSHDGCVVVGHANGAAATFRACRWTTASGGFQDIGSLPGGSGTTQMIAWGATMNGFRDLFAAVFSTPPDDVPPCVAQANSFREVVSLQTLFVTLTVALLAYVRNSPAFDLRVDLLFAVLAALPLMGLYHIVRSRVTAGSGEVYVCTKPIRTFARQAMILDAAIVVAVSLLYWARQLPGQ